MKDKPVIGFAGVTHLAVVSAAATAEKGFRTVIFGEDPEEVRRIIEEGPPFTEPDLPEMMARNAERLAFVSDASRLAECDLVFLAADVPTDAGGQSDLGPIGLLAARVRSVLKPGGLVVMMAQVPPGFTRELGIPLDRCFYLVETLIFGQAVPRALHPERFIVGAVDPSQPLPTAFASYLASFGCPILPMAYESAELAKIAINCCLVATLSATNTLAELCENIGADWRDIAGALKLDRRIGPYAYLSPGLGLGGSNLERDLITVRRLSAREGTESGVVAAWLENSVHRRAWLIRTFRGLVQPRWARPVVALLGLAYKINTDSTRNSPALAFLKELSGCEVRAHDPVVDPRSVAGVVPAASAEAAMAGAQALVLATPWSDYAALDPGAIARAMPGGIVIDPWRVLDGKAVAAAGLTYAGLGAPTLGPGGAPLKKGTGHG